MATLLLAAAGSAVGGAIGGGVLGVGAAVLGQAAGAVAGNLLDQTILGRGSRAVEVGRAGSLRLQTSTEGMAIPLPFGRMRLAGQVIWSTRFLETVRESTQGGKASGGQRMREFSYSISVAVALCEGPIERIGRVWADGQLLDLSGVTMRVHSGSEDQMPDPKIEAVEGAGNVPSYRGTAYVVFEDLALGRFGNRIPQFNFEVFRSALAGGDVPFDEALFGQPLPALVKGVALSPGTGEHALDPEPVRARISPVEIRHVNVNSPEGRPDMLVALDQLDAELPGCGSVLLIVSWFGDDIRCGRCRVEPKVEQAGRRTEPWDWSCAGLTTETARILSRDADDRPNYGGTPSDRSVIETIRELHRRGKRVLIYPFLLMDIPHDNALTDPRTGEPGQPAFPWRGRITLDAAPGQPGSTDLTEGAAAEVASFFGTATAAQFSAVNGLPAYSGPAQDWTWRRFVLHLAMLGKIAGGVDSICIGSEFVSLNRIRTTRTQHPAVGQLRALAAEVRQLLPGALISYAADWSEYWGHQPDDGTGDRLFHLDPLWADGNIDFVGIDDYLSLADWRHKPNHLDAEAGHGSTYALSYLRSNMAGGENFDWYYASEADRAVQARTPIADTAHGEDWVYRPKDFVGWWSNPHHDRVGGVRSASPTAWVPRSKPFWLVETGCPAVDLGANRPNLFFDGKSSESGLPGGSRGARDDEMQRRYLQAKLGWWADSDVNPVSDVYGGPMLPTDRIYVWTWDLRPWPDFPNRQSVWSDGPNHRLGHWITGRVSASGLAEVVAAICARSGMLDYDVSGLHGVVHGYVIDRLQSARESLQPLMTTYGFDAFESGGKVVFRMRSGTPDLVLDPALVVEGRKPGQEIEVVRGSEGELGDAVRLGYVQSERDYRAGMAEAIRPGGGARRIDETSLPIAFPSSMASAIVERWLAERARARETLSFALPPSMLKVEPGDVVAFAGEAAQAAWRIDRLTRAGAIEVEATRIDAALYLPRPGAERPADAAPGEPAGPIEALVLDLPAADGSAMDHRPFLAASAVPWAGDVAVHVEEPGGGYRLAGTLRKPAILGRLVAPLAPGLPDLWHRGAATVEVTEEGLFSATEPAVLNGANRLAVETLPGAWEILQFRDAELIAPGVYQLRRFLRGLRGTEALAASGAPAGARVVLLDDAILEVPLSLEELGLSRTYRIGPARRALDHPAHVDREAVAKGIGLRPFAPAHPRWRRLAGDVALSWIRRTRIGGDGWYGLDVPLGEERESYEVRVRGAGAVLRRETVAAPAFIYTAAMQDADGAVVPFTVEIAQVSALYGPGSARTVVIDG